MRTTLFVSLIWLIASPSSLFSADSCPVVLQDVKRDSGLGDRNTYCFSLEVKNNTSRPIRAVNLKAVAYDSKPWEHPLRYTYVVDNVPSSELKSAYFSTHRLLGGDYRGVKVWVESVEFGDKSVWSDQGQRSCAAADIKKK